MAGFADPAHHDPAAAREIEPYVRCVRALHVETTGIIDYPAVCRALADDIGAQGGEIRLGVGVASAESTPHGVEVHTTTGETLRADALVACAGLYADRVALACGLEPDARIVPFRGEYFELAPEKNYLVRNLIYPVPDPRFPFLGVHLTRMVHGGIHAGPNAVLALRREGYTWRDVDVAELRESLAWPGLWALAKRNIVPGAREVVRSCQATVRRQPVPARPDRGADLRPPPQVCGPDFGETARWSNSVTRVARSTSSTLHLRCHRCLEIADHLADSVEQVLAS
jgi:L-2-hydroxyglutarate oxidase